MRSIALANQKGGVGKTTTTVHLAHGLALAGDRVLVLDLDPQGNATLATQGMKPDDATAPEGGIYDALQPLRDGLWILPSPGASRNLSPQTVPDFGRLHGLMQALEDEGFDWVVVDCPPRMDAWGLTGVRLCQHVLLPIQPEFFAMHGLSQMLETLEGVRSEHGSCAELLGVVVTMFDPKVPVEREILANLRSNLGSRLFRSIVERDPRFVEAASHGVTLFDYCLESKGARCYGELVREICYGRA
ncbi:MAG: ParA family protein [Planctomycetes bacterium]|nr:ParA family protein [Planctomycetota bacterium]